MMKKNPPIENNQLCINGRTIAVTIIRSCARKRTITFKVNRDKTLIIQAPMRAAAKKLYDLASNRGGWILEQIDKLQEDEQQRQAVRLVTGEKFPFLGHPYPLQISIMPATRASCKLHNNYLAVNIRHFADEKNKTYKITAALISWYKQQAEIIVKQRLEVWQEILKVKATGLKITSALRRWGSCNHKNSICINWRLVHAPMELIDYVIVHELCHIVHKNHSQQFWQLVGSVLPDYKLRDKALDEQKMLFAEY